MWVEFVVGSRPCSDGFPLISRFSYLHKNQHSKLQFDLETMDKKSHLVECPLVILLLVVVVVVVAVAAAVAAAAFHVIAER